MESNAFDRIVRNLYTDASRRQLLGGLLASTAALAGEVRLGTTSAQAARKRRRASGGAASDLVAVCRITGGRPPKRIRVRRRALGAHLAHGDTRFVDCCVNDDCEVPECFTAQCVSGTCSQTQLPQGALCTFGGGAAVGNCTADAQCLPTGSGGG
jgi:hypothetical protein